MNTICTHCKSPLASSMRFCDTCGMFVASRSKERIECETHTDRTAVGICVICGRPVCSECKFTINGRVLCTNQEHHVILSEWAVLCHPELEDEASIFERNLFNHGIVSRVFSWYDHIAMRLLPQNRVSVFVKNLELNKALSLLKELNLIGND